ncbi:hypothetical protein HAX54_041231 [Datura stramonium]|uniref:Uncharacterized protein n=1 Tax=Datura stramonium TaxID=4076 RepID=A0ABS8VQ58_DATST|nr:hypothetical protein [Datura stramonium]
MEKNNDSPAGNNATKEVEFMVEEGTFIAQVMVLLAWLLPTSITCSGGGCGGGGGGFGGGGGGGGVAAAAAFVNNNRGDCSGGVAANMLEIEIIAVVVDIKVSTIHLKDTKVMHMLSVYEGYAVNSSYTVQEVTYEIPCA